MGRQRANRGKGGQVLTGTGKAPKSGKTTLHLLQRIRTGDQEAHERLFNRFLKPLQGWARGRIPRWARSMLDTDDLIQETMLRTLHRVEEFEQRSPGGFLAYLRQVSRNLIHDEIRRLKRRPIPTDTSREIEDPGPSPVESAIGRESLDRFESSLARLSVKDQEAIIARVELGLPYREVAEHLGKPSTDAARMAVSRALLRLAKEMSHEPG